jgi:hypothetical protein
MGSKQSRTHHTPVIGGNYPYQACPHYAGGDNTSSGAFTTKDLPFSGGWKPPNNKYGGVYNYQSVLNDKGDIIGYNLDVVPNWVAFQWVGNLSWDGGKDCGVNLPGSCNHGVANNSVPHIWAGYTSGYSPHAPYMIQSTATGCPINCNVNENFVLCSQAQDMSLDSCPGIQENAFCTDPSKCILPTVEHKPREAYYSNDYYKYPRGVGTCFYPIQMIQNDADLNNLLNLRDTEKIHSGLADELAAKYCFATDKSGSTCGMDTNTMSITKCTKLKVDQESSDSSNKPCVKWFNSVVSTRTDFDSFLNDKGKDWCSVPSNKYTQLCDCFNKSDRSASFPNKERDFYNFMTSRYDTLMTNIPPSCWFIPCQTDSYAIPYINIKDTCPTVSNVCNQIMQGADDSTKTYLSENTQTLNCSATGNFNSTGVSATNTDGNVAVPATSSSSGNPTVDRITSIISKPTVYIPIIIVTIVIILIIIKSMMTSAVMSAMNEKSGGSELLGLVMGGAGSLAVGGVGVGSLDKDTAGINYEPLHHLLRQRSVTPSEFGESIRSNESVVSDGFNVNLNERIHPMPDSTLSRQDSTSSIRTEVLSKNIRADPADAPNHITPAYGSHPPTPGLEPEPEPEPEPTPRERLFHGVERPRTPPPQSLPPLRGFPEPLESSKSSEPSRVYHVDIGSEPLSYASLAEAIRGTPVKTDVRTNDLHIPTSPHGVGVRRASFVRTHDLPPQNLKTEHVEQQTDLSTDKRPSSAPTATTPAATSDPQGLFDHGRITRPKSSTRSVGSVDSTDYTGHAGLTAPSTYPSPFPYSDVKHVEEKQLPSHGANVRKYSSFYLPGPPHKRDDTQITNIPEATGQTDSATIMPPPVRPIAQEDTRMEAPGTRSQYVPLVPPAPPVPIPDPGDSDGTIPDTHRSYINSASSIRHTMSLDATGRTPVSDTRASEGDMAGFPATYTALPAAPVTPATYTALAAHAEAHAQARRPSDASTSDATRAARVQAAQQADAEAQARARRPSDASTSDATRAARVQAAQQADAEAQARARRPSDASTSDATRAARVQAAQQADAEAQARARRPSDASTSDAAHAQAADATHARAHDMLQVPGHIQADLMGLRSDSREPDSRKPDSRKPISKELSTPLSRGKLQHNVSMADHHGSNYTGPQLRSGIEEQMSNDKLGMVLKIHANNVRNRLAMMSVHTQPKVVTGISTTPSRMSAAPSATPSTPSAPSATPSRMSATPSAPSATPSRMSATPSVTPSATPSRIRSIDNIQKELQHLNSDQYRRELINKEITKVYNDRTKIVGELTYLKSRNDPKLNNERRDLENKLVKLDKYNVEVEVDKKIKRNRQELETELRNIGMATHLQQKESETNEENLRMEMRLKFRNQEQDKLKEAERQRADNIIKMNIKDNKFNRLMAIGFGYDRPNMIKEFNKKITENKNAMPQYITDGYAREWNRLHDNFANESKKTSSIETTFNRSCQNLISGLDEDIKWWKTVPNGYTMNGLYVYDKYNKQFDSLNTLNRYALYENYLGSVNEFNHLENLHKAYIHSHKIKSDPVYESLSKTVNSSMSQIESDFKNSFHPVNFEHNLSIFTNAWGNYKAYKNMNPIDHNSVIKLDDCDSHTQTMINKILNDSEYNEVIRNEIVSFINVPSRCSQFKAIVKEYELHRTPTVVYPRSIHSSEYPESWDSRLVTESPYTHTPYTHAPSVSSAAPPTVSSAATTQPPADTGLATTVPVALDPTVGYSILQTKKPLLTHLHSKNDVIGGHAKDIVSNLKTLYNPPNGKSIYLNRAFDLSHGTETKLETVINNSNIGCPSLYTISEIDKLYNTPKLSNAKGVKIYVVYNVDAFSLQFSPFGKDAIVQLASQFNYLEAVSPYSITEVSEYVKDHTQGSQCALQSIPACVWRKVCARKAQEKEVPPNNGISYFDTFTNYKNDFPSGVYKNGYLLPQSSQRILGLLHNPKILNILPQWVKCDVSDSLQLHVMSAAPSFQGKGQPLEGTIDNEICKILVGEQYEAIAKLAVICSYNKILNKVHLTLVGQGAFNNNISVIEYAFKKFVDVIKYYNGNIDIFLHIFGTSTINNNIYEKLKTNTDIEFVKIDTNAFMRGTIFPH